MHRLSLAALLIIITAVWGATFSIVKDAIELYGVMPFLAVRFALGAVAVGIVSGRKLTRGSLRVGAGIGLVLGSAYVFQTFGLQRTSATNCGLITGLFVVFAPLINRLAYGVRIPRLYWIAVWACVMGMVLLTGGGPTRPTVGDLLTLGCAAAFGLHIALLDRHAKEHDAGALVFAQVGVAAVMFLLLWPATGKVHMPTPEVWGALILTGLVGTAAGFYVQTYVQQRLPAVQAAVIITMEPLFAAIFGYFLAGDRLTPIQIVGAVILVSAVTVAEAYPAIRRNGKAAQPTA